MSQREVRWTGPFHEGEKPLPVLVDFYAANPNDLSGYSLAVTCTRDGVELGSWGSAVWDDASTARAELSIPEIVLASGATEQLFKVQVWAGDGSNRVATAEIWFYGYPAVGTVPSV